MASSKVNSQAKKNGNWGEDITPRLLTHILTPELRTKIGNVEYVNDLVDFYSETGIPIEVKTCQRLVERNDTVKGVRPGRFVLDSVQHNFLLSQNGLYFFIVKEDDLVVRARLLKADEITYQRKVNWVHVMDGLA